MKLLISLFAVAALQSTQIPPLIDHIHLAVPDQAQAVAWYQKNFGGRPLPEGTDRLMFGETRLNFMKAEKAPPSAGTAIDHIGFSVADLDGTMKQLEASGAKVINPARDVPGLFKLAFVDDPWGTRIEVVQDADKLGLHHIHLRNPDPAATLTWYKERFGGETSKLKDRIDGLKYGGVWVLVQRGDATPSEGHAIDHIGFRTTDLAATATKLKTQSVKFITEPQTIPIGNGATSVKMAYVEGPAAVKIELVQR